jgi:hypothetical protein
MKQEKTTEEDIENEIMEHSKIMINSKVTDDNHLELLIKDARLYGKLQGFRLGKEQVAKQIEELTSSLKETIDQYEILDINRKQSKVKLFREIDKLVSERT